jgi:hypothetical protein
LPPITALPNFTLDGRSSVIYNLYESGRVMWNKYNNSLARQSELASPEHMNRYCSCQQYWTILLHPIQAQQYCSILLTSVNNVGRKTLFNPVEQWARRFLPCRCLNQTGTKNCSDQSAVIPLTGPNRLSSNRDKFRARWM